jgi:hypothetical protein
MKCSLWRPKEVNLTYVLQSESEAHINAKNKEKEEHSQILSFHFILGGGGYPVQI